MTTGSACLTNSVPIELISAVTPSWREPPLEMACTTAAIVSQGMLVPVKAISATVDTGSATACRVGAGCVGASPMAVAPTAAATPAVR